MQQTIHFYFYFGIFSKFCSKKKWLSGTTTQLLFILLKKKTSLTIKMIIYEIFGLILCQFLLMWSSSLY
jgi:hypothetical protein